VFRLNFSVYHALRQAQWYGIMFRAASAFGVIIFATVGAAAQQAPTYQVTGYDGRSHQWTVLASHTEQGQLIKHRLVMLCLFGKEGDGEMNKGDDACRMRVGQVIVHNPYPKGQEPYIMIWQMSPDRMAMQFGRVRDSDRWSQQLEIIKDELVP
jgi:hypothetical protein